MTPEITDNGDGTFDVKIGERVHTYDHETLQEILEPFPSLGEEELRQLALDLHEGRVFCSLHVPPQEDPFMCFMVLVLAGDAIRTRILLHKICFFYEYLEKAGPRSVNGMPTFFSVRLLVPEDALRVVAHWDELDAKGNTNPRPERESLEDR